MIFTTITHLDFDFHELIFEEKYSSTIVNKSLGLEEKRRTTKREEKQKP